MPTWAWSAIASIYRYSRAYPANKPFMVRFGVNYTDLSEVVALAAEDKIRHSIKLFKFDEINENLDLLRTGDIVGRAVMKF
jgi:D-arabinose 1-dehydrogenase-like Zn-dependent alcohol dehydrogenase